MEPTSNSDTIKVNNHSMAHLLVVVKWTRFLSIMGYMTSGLLFVLWMVMIRGALQAGREFGVWESLGWLLAIIIAVVLAGNLSSFTRAIKSSLKTADSDGLADAFGFLKDYFRLLGVLSVLGIGIPIVLAWLAVFSAVYEGLLR